MNLLGVLVKFPEPGKVKTRLARSIGNENAAREYRLIAEKVIGNTLPENTKGDRLLFLGCKKKLPVPFFYRIIFYTPAEMRDRFESWVPGNVLMPQRGCDIGEIMINCIRDLLASGAEKAVIAGSDIPKLDSNIVKQAFQELDSVDVVVGPASDGGYYLIGMKSLHEDIFKGILWSTGSVFGETVSAIRRLGLSYGTVATLCDVDSVEDLDR